MTPLPFFRRAAAISGLAAALALLSLADVGRALASEAAPDSAASAAASGAARSDSVGSRHREFPRPDAALMERLREGGYVIVFRHSITDWAQRDAEGENFENRATQRNLSKEGETQAVAIGKSMAGLGIPIGAVLASPMWRCRDTAQLAFGRHETSLDLFRRGGPSRAARVAFLSTKAEPGKNLVLVTHQDVLLPIVSGLRRDQLKEGDALVVKPLGERKFEVLAQVSPEDWARLAASRAK